MLFNLSAASSKGIAPLQAIAAFLAAPENHGKPLGAKRDAVIVNLKLLTLISKGVEVSDNAPHF